MGTMNSGQGIARRRRLRGRAGYVCSGVWCQFEPDGLPIRRSVAMASGARGMEARMLRWALIFLIVALIAAVLGFGGIAGQAQGIAKILFIIFLILFLVSLIMQLATGKKLPGPPV